MPGSLTQPRSVQGTVVPRRRLGSLSHAVHVADAPVAGPATAWHGLAHILVGPSDTDADADAAHDAAIATTASSSATAAAAIAPSGPSASTPTKVQACPAVLGHFPAHVPRAGVQYGDILCAAPCLDVPPQRGGGTGARRGDHRVAGSHPHCAQCVRAIGNTRRYTTALQNLAMTTAGYLLTYKTLLG